MPSVVIQITPRINSSFILASRYISIQFIHIGGGQSQGADERHVESDCSALCLRREFAVNRVDVDLILLIYDSHRRYDGIIFQCVKNFSRPGQHTRRCRAEDPFLPAGDFCEDFGVEISLNPGCYLCQSYHFITSWGGDCRPCRQLQPQPHPHFGSGL
nr:MAG TPA: hypothetical protein [Caudoviricetes sp.]